MRELQRKQKIKRRLYSVPILALLVILLAVFSRAAWGALEKSRESGSSVDSLEAKVEELSLREEELRANIAALETDEGVDEEIKGKFSVTKEGEHVAVIVEARGSSTTADEESEPWWLRMWNAIMGR